MALKNKPYVGVCGASTVEEARNVVSLIRGSGLTLQTDHIPMMGFQVSWKSLDFGFSDGNNRVPRFDQLAPILDAVKGDVFPTVHYYTKRPERLVQEVSTILERDGIYYNELVEGVQINRMFPAPYQIKVLKDIYSELKIVLQLYPEKDSVEKLAKRLAKDYKELDHVILDYSQGKGIEFDTEQVAMSYRAFRDHGVRAGIVFAGGFNGENVKARLTQLKEAVGSTEFSIDAEGGLRDRVGEGYGNDILNLSKVSHYLRGASEALLSR